MSTRHRELQCCNRSCGGQWCAIQSTYNNKLSSTSPTLGCSLSYISFLTWSNKTIWDTETGNCSLIKENLTWGLPRHPHLRYLEWSAYLCDVFQVIATVAECLVSVWNKWVASTIQYYNQRGKKTQELRRVIKLIKQLNQIIILYFKWKMTW